MKQWIPVAVVIGFVFAIPFLAVSNEGDHQEGKQHPSASLFEEGSGSSVLKQPARQIKSGESDHKMGSEYMEEGSGGMQSHKEGKEYSEKSMHEGGEKTPHKKIKAPRMREGS